MPNVTFPCPFCAKKMAVGADMLGKKVRCPSCKQVVVAPATESPPPAAEPVAMPVPEPMIPAPAPPPSTGLDDLPSFNFEQRESAESILSSPEESEDEVFGSVADSKLPVPSFDQPEPSAPVDDNPFGFDVAPAPAPPPPPRPASTSVPAPAPAPVPAPRPVPIPMPEPEPAPVAASYDLPPAEAADPMNPFSDFEEPVASMPAPAPVPAARPRPTRAAAPAPEAAPPAAAPEAAEPKARPERRPARPGTAPAGGGLGAPFYLLLLYAVIMTGLAVYGFAFRYGTQIDPGHPLSAIPDNFGEFPASERRKQGQLKKLPDAEMPPELKVAFRKKLELGPLEIEPTKIAIRRLEVVTVPKNGKPSESRRSEAVVMTLKIRNTSSDTSLCPLDPAFSRRYTATTDEPLPGQTLVVGKEKYRGGAFLWPPSDRILREYEQAQQDDGTPLLPGQTRDYVVFTAPEGNIVRAVRNASEPMLWRVQVRRGFIELRGKDVPVTAIFGVEFRSSDVQIGDD